MLIQFSAENFKSFKGSAILSMEASSDKDHKENTTEIGKDKLLNTVAIFGANASGKSNLFSALTSSILMVRHSNTRQVGEPLTEIVPFRFDDESFRKPTSFEFIFTTKGKKYIYGFSATVTEITKEYLYVYNSSKASTIFERSQGEKYKFTSPALKKEMLPITKRNTNNKLFLATATAWNCKETREAYLWFESGINTYSTNFEQLFFQTAPMFENDKNGSLKSFTNKLLHEADINIDNYEFESHDIPTEQLLQRIPKGIAEIMSTVQSATNKNIKIETVHSVMSDGNLKQYKLPLSEESKGTRSLFLFSPVLMKAFESGETLCIDEFDASLHPMIVTYLFSLFNNPHINVGNAQLIASSHSMALMSLENLRRDQIYFIEKDREVATSELYSLDEFSPRKEENVRRAYMLGRYGSVPDIQNNGDLFA